MLSMAAVMQSEPETFAGRLGIIQNIPMGCTVCFQNLTALNVMDNLSMKCS